MTYQSPSRFPPFPAARASAGQRIVSGSAAPTGSARAPIPPQTEDDFQRAVVELARVLGYRTYHTFDARHSAAGWPDLVLCRPPRLILAELKTNVGRLSPAQDAWLDALSRCPGAEVYVWHPRDWAGVIRVLQGGGPA